MTDSKTLGGYPITWFVDSPPHNLTCGICFDVMKKPHQCKNGHMFCLSCVTTALESNKECPTCKTYLNAERLSCSMLCRDLVADLKVNCSGSSDCDWVGPLKDREAHIAECKYQMIPCELASHGCCPGCSGTVLRSETEKHIADVISTTEKDGLSIITRLLTVIRERDEEINRIIDCIPEGQTVDSEDALGNLKGKVMVKTSHSNTFFCGEATNSKKNGNCVLRVNDYVFCGMYVNDKRSGKGRERFADGTWYEGEWLNHKKHGYGKLHHGDTGCTYVGQWQKGKEHGHGTYYDANDFVVYIGEFVDGEKSGYGEETDYDGGIYKGQFKNDLRCGHGIYRYDDGRTLEGYFVGWIGGGGGYIPSDEIATLTYVDGMVYRGEMDQDCRHGKGDLTYTNGDFISSDTWDYDDLKGACRMGFASTGNVYNGEVKWNKDTSHGTPHGMGTMVYGMSGDVYEGQWYEGRRHGQGRLVIKSTGEVQMGQFAEEVFNGDTRASDGTAVPHGGVVATVAMGGAIVASEDAVETDSETVNGSVADIVADDEVK